MSISTSDLHKSAMERASEKVVNSKSVMASSNDGPDKDCLRDMPKDFDDMKKREVCQMARREVQGAGFIGKEHGDTPKEVTTAIQNNLPQTSKWSNFILPELRSLAGCRDPSGVGTFTDCDEEASFILDELLDTFWNCVGQKIEEEFKE